MSDFDDKHYEKLKHNLIEDLFHLSDEEAKDCIREFIKDHPEILDRYTKDELLEL
jgi:hypothetical protein